MGIFGFLSRKKRGAGGDDGEGSEKSRKKAFGHNGSLSLRRKAFALGQMERAMRYNDAPTVRRQAESALGQMRSENAINGLIGCLEDHDSGVRRGAAWALGNIGDVKAVDPLIHAMKDSDWEVQVSVASALGSIGDLRAEDSLALALNEGHDNVCQAAEVALEKIRAGATPLVREDEPLEQRDPPEDKVMGKLLEMARSEEAEAQEESAPTSSQTADGFASQAPEESTTPSRRARRTGQAAAAKQGSVTKDTSSSQKDPATPRKRTGKASRSRVADSSDQESEGSAGKKPATRRRRTRQSVSA
jgi:HEAT repeat protein